MTEIIPAIIGQNFTEVANKVRLVEGTANWVHLDIMDGTFTPGTSWPAALSGQAPDDLESLNDKIKIECHLMVRPPEEILPVWMKTVDRVIVHVETSDHLTEIVDSFAETVVELGLALNLATPISKIDELIERIEVVHLMSIAEIGEHGHPFDARVLEKIKHLRARHPSATIQVDGGINLMNVRSVIEAGANNLIVGSALWQSPDPIKSLIKFQSLLL